MFYCFYKILSLFCDDYGIHNISWYWQ